MFDDRADAGRRLAALLIGRNLPEPLILALPRGGVPVAFEVARALDAPLDVLVVRKIGAPFQPELGVGAVAAGGEPLLDHAALAALGLTEAELEPVIARERAEAERRLRAYRGDREPPDVRGRTAVVVDDGLATGVTARVALRSLRTAQPARLVLAVPVGAPETVRALSSEADEVVCVEMPPRFVAVGRWYRSFDQTSDDTVADLLRRAEDGGS